MKNGLDLDFDFLNAGLRSKTTFLGFDFSFLGFEFGFSFTILFIILFKILFKTLFRHPSSLTLPTGFRGVLSTFCLTTKYILSDY